MTDCPRCSAELVDWLYDELAPEARAAFAAHLEASPACAAEARALAAAERATRPGPALEPSPAVVAGLKAEARTALAERRAAEGVERRRERRERQAAGATPSGWPRPRVAFPLWLSAAASLLVVAGGAWLALREEPAGPQPRTAAARPAREPAAPAPPPVAVAPRQSEAERSVAGAPPAVEGTAADRQLLLAATPPPQPVPSLLARPFAAAPAATAAAEQGEPAALAAGAPAAEPLAPEPEAKGEAAGAASDVAPEAGSPAGSDAGSDPILVWLERGRASEMLAAYDLWIDGERRGDTLAKRAAQAGRPEPQPLARSAPAAAESPFARLLEAAEARLAAGSEGQRRAARLLLERLAGSPDAETARRARERLAAPAD